mgnify:CR=1 FL=1
MNKLFENKSSKNDLKVFESWDFGKTNFLLVIAGLIFIISGYIFMATGEVYSTKSLTIAPIFLFLGYFLIPVALMFKNKKT